MKVKEESEKPGLKLNVQKTKIMASSPITLWKIDGETMETVRDFIFGAPISLQMVISAMKLKDTYSLEEKLRPTYIPWTEEPGGLPSMGSLRVGHDWVTSLLMRWMNLKPIIQSEVTQKKKEKYCILTHIYIEFRKMVLKSLFFGTPKSLQMVISAMKLKDTYSLEGKLWPT